jgi:2-polyprenyl-6-methoxyphenol hydroxylase-like FAD-dependent oxidoreductase
MSEPRIVIVGASLAGATAAATLRDDGFDGEIRLIGAEAQLPYNRPPLSKGYLRQNNGYQQGRAAARSLLGGTQPYDYVHSFWSDQYEHLIEYVGFASNWDRLVFRGRPESRKFLGFYLKDGIVRAAVGLNRGDPEDPNGGW